MTKIKTKKKKLAVGEKPTEPGFYWVRHMNHTYWPVLVKISGEPPFLQIHALYGKDEYERLTQEYVHDLVYSAKIHVPKTGLEY